MVEEYFTHVRTLLDKNFDKFEIYLLRNLFPLPIDFVIPEIQTTVCQYHIPKRTILIII